jgi:uncharacterized protein YkwD
MFAPRSHRLHQIAAAALPALLALTAAVPSASAHSRHHRRHRHHVVRHVVHHAVAPVARTATPPPASCSNADTSAVGAPPQAMRDAVVCLINQQRAQHGLPTLTDAPQLDQSAQAWTNLMVVQNIFTHGTNFANRISDVGYDWSNAGENIASGFATPRDVVSAWMASPDHCRNILNPNYANVGTGVNPNPILVAASGPATWTQDFGLLMTQNAPSSNMGPSNGCPY